MEEKKTNQVEDLKSSVKNTIKGIKDKATSDETKEKIKGAVDSVKDNLTKENLDKAVDTVKENLTKENLEKTANTIKENLTKENLENTVSNIKESLNEENREETIKNIKSNPKFKKIITIVAIFLVILFVFKGCGGSRVVDKNKSAPFGAEFNITFDELLKKYNKNVKNNDLYLDTLQYYTMNISEDDFSSQQVNENTVTYAYNYISNLNIPVATIYIDVNPNSNKVLAISCNNSPDIDGDCRTAFTQLVPAFWAAPILDKSLEDVINKELSLDYGEYYYEDNVYVKKVVGNDMSGVWQLMAMSDKCYKENFEN